MSSEDDYRVQRLRREFDLSSDDAYIEDFPCSYHRAETDVFTGRVYLFAENVCFKDVPNAPVAAQTRKVWVWPLVEIHYIDSSADQSVTLHLKQNWNVHLKDFPSLSDFVVRLKTLAALKTKLQDKKPETSDPYIRKVLGGLHKEDGKKGSSKKVDFKQEISVQEFKNDSESYQDKKHKSSKGGYDVTSIPADMSGSSEESKAAANQKQIAMSLQDQVEQAREESWVPHTKDLKDLKKQKDKEASQGGVGKMFKKLLM
mmetsp:Transcript_6014/g.9242  ORF Transcript_6014/g.9242 Transcript_6014/m.9242 type:complete len:258 (-) Transcript_6014:223-996(-)|eukprot:CAMPEP_0184655696 /NCGR_PEP_ID=MMETSP0308-20130426/14346_1 /TAXON_ID=38269 /ORGANISM="Gloeochaete witrockiana, Strain SAG 46.84" /LENGTH=257 /DNA_ID=CAMNT_0027092383 /DNA_START=190 /DNA_END=963 /DNA_ORIENTATION=-